MIPCRWQCYLVLPMTSFAISCTSICYLLACQSLRLAVPLMLTNSFYSYNCLYYNCLMRDCFICWFLHIRPLMKFFRRILGVNKCKVFLCCIYISKDFMNRLCMISHFWMNYVFIEMLRFSNLFSNYIALFSRLLKK